MTAISIPYAPLAIADLKQVAEGGERVVYTARNYPGVVFKLQKMPDPTRMKRRDLKGLLLRHWRGFHNYSVVQEQKTFVKASLARTDSWDNLPYARFFWFCAV